MLYKVLHIMFNMLHMKSNIKHATIKHTFHNILFYMIIISPYLYVI